MKPVNSQQHQDYIEIPLYQQGKAHTSLGHIIIKVFSVVLIGIGILYFIVKVTAIVFSILIVCLVLLFIFIYEYYDHLFPSSQETLIIAYGEIHLLDKDSVKWCKPIKACQFEQVVFQNTQMPIIKIVDNQQFNMTVQYTPIDFFKQTFDTSSEHYIIYSKTNWNTLLELLDLK